MQRPRDERLSCCYARHRGPWPPDVQARVDRASQAKREPRPEAPRETARDALRRAYDV